LQIALRIPQRGAAMTGDGRDSGFLRGIDSRAET
jgi:hypothetical protein